MSVHPATPDIIEAAAQRLRHGELVAFPTETVYGLGGDARNPQAVAAIYAAKGRPSFNPLITHVPSLADVARLAKVGAIAETLAHAFWPGPLTLVLQRTADCPVCDLATAGLPTLAVRVPSHPVAQALLTAAGIPVAAPSANRSGHVSPTRAAHVEADLGQEPVFILDGGPTAVGLESTVVDATGASPVVLRLGGVTREALQSVLSMPVAVARGDADLPASPGMLARHYAPHTPIRLEAVRPLPEEAWLAFGPETGNPVARAHVNLSPRGDLVEAAANLFAALRTLDAAGASAIAVAPIPERGLGAAINDRLRRAALGRGD